MAKPLHFDKIEEYLTGQMPEDRAHAFEQEAANNPQLATELELQRLEHDAMERMLERELKNKMTTSWADSPPVNPFLEKQEAKVVQMDSRKNWGVLRIAAAIGGVLLVAALLWRLTSNETNDMVNEPPKEETPAEPPIEEIPPTLPTGETEVVETPEEPINNKTTPKPEIKPSTKPAPPQRKVDYLAFANDAYQIPAGFASGVRSGDVASEKSPLLLAAEALDKGRYTEALKLLGPPADGDQSQVRYFRGHAYFKTGKYQSAAGQFQYMADNELMPYHQESQWYLLLSYLAQLPKTEKEFKALAGELAADEK